MAELYNHIDELIIKHLQQSLTAAEDALLQQWLQTNPAHQLLFNRINNASNINEALATLYTFNEQQGWAKLTAEYKFTNEEEEAGSPESLVVSIKPRTQLWKRIAIAASILITIGIAAYVISTKEKSPAVVVSPDQQHDVQAPQTNRAQIKLADGSILYLDSAANGQLVNTNGVTVTKTEDGKIVYSSLTTHDSPLTYNTLMNPRGSKVQPLALSDGTKVWLNAESSITYPTAFVANERKVTITGEAYFEVAKSFTASGAKQTFIVEANGTTTEVLGTHFNVNAYDDENDIKVTLLEGSVKVSSLRDKVPGQSVGGTKQSAFLKPGEQAVLTPDSRLTTNGSPDIDQVMAWKNGYFQFNRSSLQEVMRQIERWYDVEVVYEGAPAPMEFGGKITRTSSAAEVLKILALSKVNFRIEGKRIVVLK